ncbi:MAG: hypothetical protein OYH77_03480 [Pseudomonadota bacterium]|nr:hypothetical protein [Pseudomonadota bacterium]
MRSNHHQAGQQAPALANDDAENLLRKLCAKLDWHLITQRLARFCYSDEAKQQVEQLRPTMTDVENINATWQQTCQLRELAERGYVMPSLQLPAMGEALRFLSQSQTLETQHLQQFQLLLQATKKWYLFAKQFADDCPVLRHYRARLVTMPQLSKVITDVIDTKSAIKDTASKELQNIRRQSVRLRHQIEEKILQMFHRQQFEPYLQDDYFTVRQGKYVIPLRVDGNGRVQGNAIDFSRSKETIFFEPQAIEKQNQLLRNVEFAETVACYNVLRDTTTRIGQDYQTLRDNYQALLALDTLQAKAQLAIELQANPVQLVAKPTLKINDLRHPLLLLQSQTVRPNTVMLAAGQTTMVISGANAGGKTVLLKAVAMLQLMAKAGLLLPCGADSQLSLATNTYFVAAASDDMNTNLSTFSKHISELQQVLAACDKDDLVLIDEIAAGTEPDTGAALAQAIIEDLTARQALTIVTTHLGKLKELAYHSSQYRNAAMHFSQHNLRPTYRLQLDVHGESFALEVAQALGIAANIVARAKELCTTKTSDYRAALAHLAAETKKLQAEKDKLNLLAMRYEQQWQQKLAEVESLRAQLHEQTQHRPLPATPTKPLVAPSTNEQNFGAEIVLEELKIGDRVYCLPLRRSVIIKKIGRHRRDMVEVDAQGIRMKVKLSDLRRC